MNISWRFRLSEPVASISQMLLQENISYWSEQHKFWFYGYETVEAKKALIWGRKVAVTINIAPRNCPVEKYPIEPIKRADPKKSQLTPERELQLDHLQEKLNTLTESIPPPLADENIYWNYINPKVFVENFHDMVTKWNDREVELIDKFSRVTPSLIQIYNSLKDLKLPDELMRDDTQFCLALTRILQYVDIIKENADIHRQILSQEIEKLQFLLNQLIDCMIEGGHKIFGMPPIVDENQRREFVEKKVSVIYNQNLTIDKRMEILEKLREDPCADTDDQVELLNESIKSIWMEVEKEPKKPACPHKELINSHLEGIRLCLKELQEDGEAKWQLLIADEMLDAANSWRESGDMPILTKEGFALLIYLTDLHIVSTEMEDGSISYKLELYFEDKEDSFDGHVMYAKILDKEISEITLMG